MNEYLALELMRQRGTERREEARKAGLARTLRLARRRRAKEDALLARPIYRVPKMLLGPFSCLRRTLPQDEFTFDAQEFGDAPALLIALGSRERLVDYREPFGSLAVTTEGVRNLGEK